MWSILDLIHFILNISDYLKDFIKQYGTGTYLILFTIIFIETGLVVFPYLPGDSLIFAAGALAAIGLFNPWILFIVFVCAAMAGDNVNYWIGHSIGPKIFKQKNSKFFNKKQLDRAHTFYQKHGGKTVVIARYIPIIRTFAPFVAGIGAMEYRRYIVFEIIGTWTWVALMLSIGFWFGNIPYVKDHLETVFLAIIIISFVPLIGGILYDYLKHKKAPKHTKRAKKSKDLSEE